MYRERWLGTIESQLCGNGCNVMDASCLNVVSDYIVGSGLQDVLLVWLSYISIYLMCSLLDHSIKLSLECMYRFNLPYSKSLMIQLSH